MTRREETLCELIRAAQRAGDEAAVVRLLLEMRDGGVCERTIGWSGHHRRWRCGRALPCPVHPRSP